MPFQSEKQRRYLWANEPEIARDWTDTYGSGIAKALGGRIGLASGYKAALEKKSDQELRQWIDDQLNSTGSGDTQAEAILKERGIETTIKDRKATYDYSGAKVKKAGEEYSDIFGGMYETDEDKQQAQDFMKRLSGLKHGKKLHELSAGKELLEEMQDDRDAFEEKYGIDDYEMLNEAIGAGWDEAKGTIEFDPNNVQINKAGMIPENFIENFKSLWGGEPEVPTGIMKAGTPFMDPTDANYIPRETMANWSQFDDAESEWNAAQGFEDSDEEAAYADYASGLPTLKNQWNMPNWKMPNLSNVGNLASGAYRALKGSVPWTWGAQALNFIGGNRGPRINRPTQNFINQYSVGRNPITGRMTSGPFAGRNLPGTSLMGSKTPQQMAQNWMSKYGSMDYNTERQIAKQKEIRDIAAGNLNLPPSERTVTPTHGNDNTGGYQERSVGQQTSGRSDESWKNDPFARGGLAGLWPR